MSSRFSASRRRRSASAWASCPISSGRSSCLRLTEQLPPPVRSGSPRLLQERKTVPLCIGDDLFRLCFCGGLALPVIRLHACDVLDDFQWHLLHLFPVMGLLYAKWMASGPPCRRLPAAGIPGWSSIARRSFPGQSPRSSYLRQLRGQLSAECAQVFAVDLRAQSGFDQCMFFDRLTIRAFRSGGAQPRGSFSSFLVLRSSRAASSFSSVPAWSIARGS